MPVRFFRTRPPTEPNARGGPGNRPSFREFRPVSPEDKPMAVPLLERKQGPFFPLFFLRRSFQILFFPTSCVVRGAPPQVPYAYLALVQRRVLSVLPCDRFASSISTDSPFPDDPRRCRASEWSCWAPPPLQCAPVLENGSYLFTRRTFEIF